MTSGTHKPKRQLATEIATAIRDGAYRSGEWLRQVDLEEKFNAKRFDVRTALAELALRKTVVHVANRGYRVAVPDINETHELLAIRILLEVEAATLALPHIGPDAMREIGAARKPSSVRSPRAASSNSRAATTHSMTPSTGTGPTANWWSS